nr:DUF1194 domain-containing protein [Salipiger pentaromativorans]
MAASVAASGPLSPVRVQDGDGPVEVDVALVLAVDVSRSMDPGEQILQRNGYADTIRSPEFVRLITGGRHGAIAIAYFEWAGPGEQRLVADWHLLDSAEAAADFAARLQSAPISRAARTSISAAILHAVDLFERSPYRGEPVLDLSADGPNNEGIPVTAARDLAVARGITINGLPIMLRDPAASPVDIEDLDLYFQYCVVGGDRGFVIPITSKDQFRSSIRTKLMLEVARAMPSARAEPIRIAGPRVSCTIGEELQRSRDPL